MIEMRTCRYCGKERPLAEMKPGRVRMNGAWHEFWFCADTPCKGYFQMGCEG